MDRALALARRGQALASPNPMVGAILVKNGKLVGQGFHTYQGKSHAEIIALQKAGSRARGATVFVNLEPCCHTGRTGPCTDALISAGIRRAVIAMADPNPLVSGRGIQQLRSAGIQVVIGVGESEARRLNEGFAVWIRSQRPLVTLKAAMTLDGCMSLPLPDSQRRRPLWITSKIARQEVQRMRHASDAILTGIGTILADDPLLTDRTGLPRRRRLLRVLLDSKLRLPLASRLVRTAHGDVLVFTAPDPPSAKLKALAARGAEVVPVETAAAGLNLHAVLEELGRREILSLMLEPGPTLFDSALRAGIVDKVRIFYAPRLAGPAPPRPGCPPTNPALRRLSHLRICAFGPDFAIEGYLKEIWGA